MELTPFQKDILDYLKEHPESSAKEVTDGTKIGKSTVNYELRVLTRLGELVCDNKRQPYLYSINTDSESVAWRNAVRDAKKALLSDTEPNHPLMKLIKKFKKEDLSEIRKQLLQVAEAIDELDKEGKLIPTLEVADYVTVRKAG